MAPTRRATASTRSSCATPPTGRRDPAHGRRRRELDPFRHGWVAGYQGELFYTDDGGVSWAEHDPSTVGNRLYAIVLRDATHGWAVGETGTIIACTD